LGAVLLAGLAAAESQAMAAENVSSFPIRVSENSRYLVDAGGKPFLLHGDTAWCLLVQLTKEEAEEYLENRRQKGFNAILILLIDRQFGDKRPSNIAGDAPFTTPGDFSTPNEAYFAHADWIIRKAGEKGIVVVLNPACTGTSRNWLNTINANGPTKCRNYGRYIGNRYRNFTNIIWQAVGDTTPRAGSELERNWLEILQGIKESAPSHHWTAHYARRSTARDQAAFAPHMTLDNAYGGNRSYIQTLQAWNRPNPLPTFYNEGYYEDTVLGVGAVGTPTQMRAQICWALLSGATGHIFGSDHVWGFGAPQGLPGKPQPPFDWRAGLDRQPSREMGYIKKIFAGRAWHALVPDQDHTVVTKGYGTFGKEDRTPGGDFVTAARTSDGSLVMAYIPSTGTGTRTITVDMARLNGPTGARWFNPTSGASVMINGSPFANSGTRDFTTPGDNGSGANDWVLVVETDGKER